MRATQRPNPRTQPSGRSATSVAVRGTSSSHGPRSLRELGRLGLHKRSPWSGLAPPTPTSDLSVGVDARRRWTAPIFRKASRAGRDVKRPSSVGGRQHRLDSDRRMGAGAADLSLGVRAREPIGVRPTPTRLSPLKHGDRRGDAGRCLSMTRRTSSQRAQRHTSGARAAATTMSTRTARRSMRRTQ